MLGFPLFLPGGFPIFPVLALGCEGLTFRCLFGAQLIEHGQPSRLAGFATLAFDFKPLLGVGQLLIHVCPRLMQSGFNLGNAGGSFSADLGDGFRSGLNALFGGLNGGFGGGATFLFHQQPISEFAVDRLDGFKATALIVGFVPQLLLFGDGGVASLFGAGDGLRGDRALFLEGRFSVLHGEFPEGVQRGGNGFGNGGRQDDFGRFGELLLPAFQMLADGGVAAGAEQFAHALNGGIETAPEQAFSGILDFFVTDSGTGHGIG